jgi:hypothetical protein
VASAGSFAITSSTFCLALPAAVDASLVTLRQYRQDNPKPMTIAVARRY